MIPLDLFIIEANAIDVAASTGHDQERLLPVAHEKWDQRPEFERMLIREVYSPAFARLTAAILRDLASEVAATEDGSVIDVYRREFADYLTNRADTQEQK